MNRRTKNQKAKTVSMKKGRKRGEGVWLGTISGLGTPDTTEQFIGASFRRSLLRRAGSGVFPPPRPSPLRVQGLFGVFCEAV